MLKIFKFMKLNSYLQDCKIIRPIYHQINSLNLVKCLEYFSLQKQSTRQNLKRLFQILYQKNFTPVRIKILILIHHLITNYNGFAEFFLQFTRKQFDGPTIVKKQQVTINDVKKDRLSQSLTFTKKSLDEDISYEDSNVYLHLYLLLPYFSYLMKLSANIEFYQDCQTNYKKNVILENPDFDLIWKLINTINNILYIKDTLTHIGRYYIKISSYIISFIETITRDINIYYTILSKHMIKAAQSYESLTKIQMENFLSLLEEIHTLNQMLFQIYLNRYFFRYLKNIIQPKWFNLSHDFVQKLISIYHSKFSMVLIKNKIKMTYSKIINQEPIKLIQAPDKLFKTEEC